MTVQIVKWGNSQGIRLPKSILEEAGMSEHEEVTLYTSDGKIIIEKTFQHKTLEERAAKYKGHLGPYQEYNWGDPTGKEVW